MSESTNASIRQLTQSNLGVGIALLIIALWLTNLYIALQYPFSWSDPVCWLLFILQTHLFTGLFITAHDAMHHTIAPKIPRFNHAIGRICTFLYAFFPYQKLFTEHHRHHRHVHTDDDPDYYEGNFVMWYLQFIKNYLTIWQILAYAIVFNILKLYLPTSNLIFFWIAPALLSTLQLFYFGTYLPHKGEHDNHHQSRSLSKNHFWAFVSCYFFGYHYEHHDKPFVPWWQLWRVKD